MTGIMHHAHAHAQRAPVSKLPVSLRDHDRKNGKASNQTNRRYTITTKTATTITTQRKKKTLLNERQRINQKSI